MGTVIAGTRKGGSSSPGQHPACPRASTPAPCSALPSLALPVGLWEVCTEADACLWPGCSWAVQTLPGLPGVPSGSVGVWFCSETR